MTHMSFASAADPQASAVFPQAGELGRLCRELDWGCTPLGPVRDWPQSLRTAAGLVVAAANAMVLLWGPDLVMIYNDAYREVMGAKHPAGLGQPLRECWSEVWDELAPIVDRVLRCRESVSFQDRPFTVVRHGYPEQAFFTASYSPVPDDAGNVGGVLAIAVETTTRVQGFEAEREGQKVQEALRWSEERFRALVSASSDVVFRLNADWSEMLHLDGRGFIPDTSVPSNAWLDEYIHPDDRERVLEAVREATRTRGLFEMEHRVRRVDGSVGWALSRAVPLLDERGEIVEWFGAAADVTERKRSEEALQRSEERLQRMTNVDGVGVLVFDEQSGAVLDANNAFLQAFGYSREDVLSGELTWMMMTPPEFVAVSEKQLEKLAATGRIGPYEKEYLHKDGSRSWMLFAGASLGDGTLAEYCIDISDRKRAEAELVQAKEVAEKANRVKSQFLSTLSHELRTPLSAVIGFTELLEAQIPGPINEKQKDYLERVSATAWHLTSIIDEILTFSRTEAGKERAVLARADVAEIARGVVSILTSQAQARDLALRLEGADVPVEILTDAGKLRQILLNLAGNALKFTRTGSVSVALRPGVNLVEFHVCDTGPGIPEEKLEQIFEPFTQLDGSMTRETGGTGLGLTICRRLARLLGGDVSVESTLGQGSTFILRLPAPQDTEPPLVA